jgi:hypothetical protein
MSQTQAIYVFSLRMLDMLLVILLCLELAKALDSELNLQKQFDQE